MDASSCVLALHGCNEANKESMDMAITAGALWCVMPCCILADLYLPTCTAGPYSRNVPFSSQLPVHVDLVLLLLLTVYPYTLTISSSSSSSSLSARTH
jgi:hypothetical protein